MEMPTWAPPELRRFRYEEAIKEGHPKAARLLQFKGPRSKGRYQRACHLRNALLPVLNLSGEYASQGLAETNRPC